CEKPRFKQVYPVKGRILVNGKPEEGVSVGFHSLDDPNDALVRPQGTTDADGWFTVNTYKRNDGLPAGSFAVNMLWLPKNFQGDVESANKLQARYANPETSGFKVEIIEGENVLPVMDVQKK